MATGREILKKWFETGDKPTQGQFYALIDSYWHIDDQLTISDIKNLSGTLAGKASSAQLIALKDRLNAPPIQVNGVSEYTIDWDDQKKIIYGDFGKFQVWQNGSLELVPISFEKDAMGMPTKYIFILSELETQIFIL